MLWFYVAPGSNITLSLPLIRMVMYSILISLTKKGNKIKTKDKIAPTSYMYCNLTLTSSSFKEVWERHGVGASLISRFASSCKNCNFSCFREKSQKSQGWQFFESQLRELQKIASLTSFRVTCDFSQFFVMLKKSQFLSGTLLPPLTREFINFSKFCNFFNIFCNF